MEAGSFYSLTTNFTGPNNIMFNSTINFRKNLIFTNYTPVSFSVS